MHDLVKNIIEKYQDKHKEVEEYFHQHSNESVLIPRGKLEKLAEAGILPKELWEHHCRRIKIMQDESEKNKRLREENPDISDEEFMKLAFPSRELSPEETAQTIEDGFLGGELLMWLMRHRHLLDENALIPTTPTPRLYDIEEGFGIAHCISNSLYHLEELLKNMKKHQLYENVYEAKGSLTNSKGEAISLIYSFQASSEKEAEKILEEYKSIMITKGLKVWLAHWLMANKIGRVEYECPMIEIMKLISDEDREAFFSVKEKEEHWALTKMLTMSKLSREKPMKKRGTAKEFTRWIEQPLVEICGGEKEITANDKYPTAISVRVLMPRVDKEGFAPNLYNNNTVLLSPSDTFLAFKLQTRANQMNRGNRNLHVDWDFIFEAGNLQATANTKKAVAKAQARKKMDRLQKHEIIENWNEELMGICITPMKCKKKNKSNNKAKKGENKKT
jgi:hypothetical protein